MPQDKSKPTVLVIDDDRSVFLLVRKALEGVCEIATATTGDEGASLAKSKRFDAVLLDIMLPDRSGLAVFCELNEHDRRLPVIFMTVEAASNSVIEAMQLGAYDYLAKPLAVANLRQLVARAIEQRELASIPVAIVAGNDSAATPGDPFIGRSLPMLEVFKAIGRVSKQNVPVLIRGESGTGKELVARALVQFSHRVDAPFLAVNCAALPNNLLESELFGHEQGAFTGADSRRVGKFEQCNHGTLFLDEIGDMASIVQSKVLRVLQEQRFERIGGNNELKTDVRIVAATNRPLEEMVDDGEFREDLLYRLNTVTIQLPPIRDRPSDIPLLIQHFLNQAKREFNKPDLEGVLPETVELLQRHSWPGNVRQLRAVIRKCVLDTVLPVLTPDVLPSDIRDQRAGPMLRESAITDVHDEQRLSLGRELPELIDRLFADKSKEMYSQVVAYAERYLIVRVLRETEGNQSRAAELLGITRGKLRDRIATHKIRLESGVTIGE
ncbi:MAG: sigma-54 dependent transcriptional regulator [Planctomycetota bacterium]